MDDTQGTEPIEQVFEQTETIDPTTQVMTPEMIMSIIDYHLGSEVIIISQEGWAKFVEIWKDSPDEDLEDKMVAAEVGVMPLSLGKSEKVESRIIIPDASPQGDTRIVKP